MAERVKRQSKVVVMVNVRPMCHHCGRYSSWVFVNEGEIPMVILSLRGCLSGLHGNEEGLKIERK